MDENQPVSATRRVRAVSVHYESRRERILDAAVEAAAHGGYDRVHMRDIAGGAGVSLATLYHYFPSKVHLLMTALERELIRFDDHISAGISDVTDDYSRLRIALWRLINGMEQSARVTDALTHAYVAAQVAAAAEAEAIRTQTNAMFVRLMNFDGSISSRRRNEVAAVVTDVWTSEILALVQGRRSYEDIRQRLSKVIDLLSA